MSNDNRPANRLIMEHVPNQEKANDLMGRLFALTNPTAVYGTPITVGEYTVIPAAEVTANLSMGYGGGFGSSGGAEEGAEGEPTSANNSGGGGGGGGFGAATARPVAYISIGPNGVHMEPVVDATKIAIAFITAVGAMALSLGKMRRFQKTRRMD